MTDASEARLRLSVEGVAGAVFESGPEDLALLPVGGPEGLWPEEGSRPEASTTEEGLPHEGPAANASPRREGSAAAARPPRRSAPATGRQPRVRPLVATADERAAGIARYEVGIEGWLFVVRVESASRARLRERAAQAGERAGAHGSTVVTALIPGRVARLWVAEGDTVEAGQRLLAIEAMKMENEVRAPRAGTIEAVKVGADSSVELGDELLTVR